MNIFDETIMTQNRARHACMAGAVFRYVHDFYDQIGAAAQFARRRHGL